MDVAFLWTLGSVLGISLVSLVGVLTIAFKEESVRGWMHLLVGLAAGALLGDALVHLVPEALGEINNTVHFSFAIIAGLLSFFVLEKTLRWHHHHDMHGGAHKNEVLGTLVIVADGIHNAIDGVIIAASYLVSIPVGIATTAAVFLHEIPQEIGDFSLLLHAGYSRWKALAFNFLSALTAVLGALAVFAFKDSFDAILPIAAAFTAGGFIYIAAADLIPELHETTHPKQSVLQFLAMLLGIAAMFALLAIEG